MPGDTLHMRDGLLHVNGVAQRQGFAAASNPKGDPNEVEPAVRVAAAHRAHELALRRARRRSPTHDNWGPLVVPAGHYFMMGDNRYCSKDSRYWGLVPRENVRGRPMFVYYSYRPGDVPAAVCTYETSDRRCRSSPTSAGAASGRASANHSWSGSRRRTRLRR